MCVLISVANTYIYDTHITIRCKVMARRKHQSPLDRALIEVLKVLPSQAGAPSKILLRDFKAVLLNERPIRQRDKKVIQVPLEKHSWQSSVHNYLEQHGHLPNRLLDQLRGFARLDQSLTNHLVALSPRYVKIIAKFHRTTYSPGDLLLHYQDPDFRTAILAHVRTRYDKIVPGDLYPKAWAHDRGIYLAAHDLRDEIPSSDLDEMIESIDAGIMGALDLWEQVECATHIDIIIALDLELNALLKDEKVAPTGFEHHKSMGEAPSPNFALFELRRQEGKISNLEYKREINRYFHKLNVLDGRSQPAQAAARRIQIADMREHSRIYYYMIRRKAMKVDEMEHSQRWMSKWRSLLRPFLVLVDSVALPSHYEAESGY